jgi:antitoxin VapB
MSLNIKSKQAHQLAAKVSKLTGETLTEAVTQALRERVDRLQRQQDSSLSERLAEIGKDAAKHLKEPFRSMNPDDFLYDEKGLPK